MKATAALGLLALVVLPGVSSADHGSSPVSGHGLVGDDAGARPPPAPPPAAAECATDADCHADHRHGHCFTPGLAAQYTQAFQDCADGAAWRAAHGPGTCIYDECRTDEVRGTDTCGAGHRCATLDMVPFPQRVCIEAACAGDRDCRHQAGGRCASYLAGGRCVRGGWSCSYPHDTCAPRDAQRMCPVHGGAIPFCAPRNGRFVCVDEPAARRP